MQLRVEVLRPMESPSWHISRPRPKLLLAYHALEVCLLLSVGANLGIVVPLHALLVEQMGFSGAASEDNDTNLSLLVVVQGTSL